MPFRHDDSDSCQDVNQLGVEETTQELIQEDVYDLIRLYHEVLGGQPRYRRLSRTAKSLCMGLKKSLIRKKFRNAAQLRKHLETIELE